ncbi:MAG: hypothetical protein AAGA12_15570 [Pseudomonadota bacterium]
MKPLFASLAVAFALLAGPVAAQSEQSQPGVESGALSDSQLDSLVSILSGLPRQ